MKKHRISSTLYYLASILFYVSAMITFSKGNTDSMGTVWLCLGSTFLCFAIMYSRKERHRENQDKENE